MLLETAFKQHPRNAAEIIRRGPCRPQKQVLREGAFHRDTINSQTSMFVRRVGRPRQNWAEQLVGVMKQAAGSYERWLQAIGCARTWRDISATIS